MFKVGDKVELVGLPHYNSIINNYAGKKGTAVYACLPTLNPIIKEKEMLYKVRFQDGEELPLYGKELQLYPNGIQRAIKCLK